MSEKIYLTKTAKEWETIDKKLSQLGKSDLGSFIHRKISVLEKEYKKCPKCVCDLMTDATKKKISINAPQVIQKVSVKTGKPLATVLDRLIIEPFLLSL